MIAPPDSAIYEKAVGLYHKGQLDEALSLCDDLIRTGLSDSKPLFLSGLIFRDRGATEKAIFYLHRAWLFFPDNAAYVLNLGIAYHMGEMGEEAKLCYEKVLGLKPDHPDACNNLGKIYLDTGQLQEAVAWFEKCVESTPDYFQAFFNMGIAHQEMKNWKKAENCYVKCLDIHPNYEFALNNLAIVYHRMNELEKAIQVYRDLLKINPDYIEAYNNMGVVYQDMGSIEEAIDCYRKSLEKNPDNQKILSNFVDQLQYACLWEEVSVHGTVLKHKSIQTLNQGSKPGVTPFSSLKFYDDPEFNLQVSKAYAAKEINRLQKSQFYPLGNTPARDRKKAGARIKIGYVSDDFRDHAMGHILNRLFSMHDREKFEIICYSHVRMDDAEEDYFTREIMKGCDRFVDILSFDTFQSAQKIYEDGIDILIDLKGYTHSNRMGIFAHRPTPIQISYLGFLSTTGADFMDYMIADVRVIPEETKSCYSEKIIYLPCYQVTDNSHLKPTAEWKRKDCGLPEEGFVFCSFNQPYKFDAELFGLWMDILGDIQGSVLWLRHTSDLAMKNLRLAAAGVNVDPERLIFAPKVGLADHLERLKLADLALDTRGYNGGATTSNALWAGVPVVTLEGRQFVARMSASNLSAIGMDELITDSLEAYEKICLRLSSDPEYYKAIRHQIGQNQSDSLLFDMEKFVRHLESAFKTVWSHYQAGYAPVHIDLA